MGIRHFVTLTCDDCQREETFEGVLGSYAAGRSGWRSAFDPADGRIFCEACQKVREQSRREIKEKVEQQLF